MHPRLEGIPIPRGNTQKDVNRTVLELLAGRPRSDERLRVLDAPCGKGEFLACLARLFPGASLTGADRVPASLPKGARFVRADLAKRFPAGPSELFDLITSVSGVMVFGNTQSFLEGCARHLKKGGTLVITNDNCSTARDRLSYLFLGKFRRFGLLPRKGEGNTQYVPQGELARLLGENGIRIRDVVYTSFYWEDLLFLPLALLLWPLQAAYRSTSPGDPGPELRAKLFPFKSLLHRHYVVIGEKT